MFVDFQISLTADQETIQLTGPYRLLLHGPPATHLAHTRATARAQVLRDARESEVLAITVAQQKIPASPGCGPFISGRGEAVIGRAYQTTPMP